MTPLLSNTIISVSSLNILSLLFYTSARHRGVGLRRWRASYEHAEAFLLNTLFIAVFSETPGGVQTKYSVNKQEVNECNWRNITIQHGYTYCRCWGRIYLLMDIKTTKARRYSVRQTLPISSLSFILFLQQRLLSVTASVDRIIKYYVFKRCFESGDMNNGCKMLLCSLHCIDIIVCHQWQCF